MAFEVWSLSRLDTELIQFLHILTFPLLKGVKNHKRNGKLQSGLRIGEGNLQLFKKIKMDGQRQKDLRICSEGLLTKLGTMTIKTVR